MPDRLIWPAQGYDTQIKLGVSRVILFMKLYPAILLFPLLLVGCGASGKSTVDSFLRYASNGDRTAVQQSLCVQSDAQSFPLNAVRSWEVLNERSQDGHKVVTARVNSSDSAGQPITKDWNFEVWATDAAIANNRKVLDQLKAKGIQVEDASPNRSDWSPNRNCIVIEEES